MSLVGISGGKCSKYLRSKYAFSDCRFLRNEGSFVLVFTLHSFVGVRLPFLVLQIKDFCNVQD